MSCITLLSDFGLLDPSVAIAKGVIMQQTSLPIIDISHEVKQFQVKHAAYLLGTSYSKFPINTCHVVLFDIFSEKQPTIVLCQYNNHYFLTPDNGVVPMALGATPQSWCYCELKNEDNFISWLENTGAAVAALQLQTPTGMGLPEFTLKNTHSANIPSFDTNSIHCEVIHIDHYENVVLNVTKRQFEELRNGRNFTLQFMQVEEIYDVSNSYREVRDGIKLCRFNSNGYLEIAINRGKAASLFGLRIGSKLNNIKIIFE